MDGRESSCASPVALLAAGLTDAGRVRGSNQDALAVLPEQGWLIVSDGLGGRNAGEAASRVVVEVLPRVLRERLASTPHRTTAVHRILRDAIVEMSQDLHRSARGRPGLAGMGATLVLVCIFHGAASIASMGDSRAYLFRGGRLRCLTRDHSVAGILLRNGEISEEEAKTHPGRKMLSRYVGMPSAVYPDVRTVPLKPGDRLLLCTDGLTRMVSETAIAEVLDGGGPPEAACRTLVDSANAAGGDDNVTVLVAEWRAA